MSEIPWATVAAEFVPDGSLRDIFIPNTDLAAWQNVLDAVRVMPLQMSYYRNEQTSELPAAAADAFPGPGECDRRLELRFAGIQANCHFFTPQEVEFDIDPREVKGQEQLDALFAVMRCLAVATGQPVMLTQEDCREIVIFRVRPGESPTEYQEFGGWHDWRDPVDPKT